MALMLASGTSGNGIKAAVPSISADETCHASMFTFATNQLYSSPADNDEFVLERAKVFLELLKTCYHKTLSNIASLASSIRGSALSRSAK